MVLIILQDTQKLLSIVLSYSPIVSEIERTCALNSSRLFLYLYQMLIEIPFFKKKSIYLPHWCDCFYVIADCLDPIRRIYYTNIELGDVYEGPATIPSPGYRSVILYLFKDLMRRGMRSHIISVFISLSNFLSYFILRSFGTVLSILFISC